MSVRAQGVFTNATLERARGSSILLAVVVLFAALSVSSSAFLTERNLLNLVDQSVTVGVIACATTLVIVAGGFDLSAGAVFAVSGIIAAKLSTTIGVAPAIVLGIGSGAAFGLVNGILVTAGRINSFLATLASGTMIVGIASVVTGGYDIRADDGAFTTLGRGDVLGVKYTVVVFAAVAIAFGVLLARTAFGRAVFAMGSNPTVAELAGLRVGIVRTLTFVLSGAAAGIAGVCAASQFGQAQVGSGVGLELDAIAAVAIGGTSILGGSGAVWRTVLGVLLLGLVRNGLNLLGVEPAYQQVASGAIIVAALALDRLARRGS